MRCSVRDEVGARTRSAARNIKKTAKRSRWKSSVKRHANGIKAVKGFTRATTNKTSAGFVSYLLHRSEHQSDAFIASGLGEIM